MFLQVLLSRIDGAQEKAEYNAQVKLAASFETDITAGAGSENRTRTVTEKGF